MLDPLQALLVAAGVDIFHVMSSLGEAQPVDNIAAHSVDAKP